MDAVSMYAFWTARSDWGALMDVLPSMHIALWVCTIISIALNSVCLFRKER